MTKLKIDENLSRHLKPDLERHGHDIKTVHDEELLGKSDVEVGAAAKDEDRMVFTLDLDFGDLRKFAPGSHPGVVLFRPASMGPHEVNRFVLSFVQDADLSEIRGCVVIVEPARVRVRRPPVNGESMEWDEHPLGE